MSTRFADLRRFKWLILLSMVVVTAIAVAVALKTTKQASATSVVVVSPGTGSTAPGEATEARDLATTYVLQLHTDAMLLRHISSRTGLTISAVSRDLTTAQVPNTALVTATFRTRNRITAMTGIRALASFATRPPPDSSLYAVSPDLVKLTQQAMRVRVPGRLRYSASATFVIPSTPSNPGPGNGDQANTVAATLTGLIPTDHQTLQAVAHELHMSTSDVRSSVSATNEQNTSLIELTFENSSPRIAQRGAITLAQDVTGAHPVSPNIPPASLSVVTLPSLPSKADPLKLAVPAGLVLGLMLGGVLLMAFSRAFPRVENEQTLAALAGCPASHISLPINGQIEALRDRWATFLGPSGGTVALVSTDDDQTDLTDVLADAVNGNGSGDPRYASQSRPADQTGLGSTATPEPEDSVPDNEQSLETSGYNGAHVVARPAGAPTGDGRAERIAQESDLAVLVVVQGTSDEDVERAAQLLADYGRPPVWAVLMPRQTRDQNSA